MKKIIILLLASGVVANASITVSGAAVTRLGDENGDPLAASSTFAMLVELNGDASDAFDGLVMSDTIAIGQTVGGGKYFVLQVGTSAENFGPSNGQVGIGGVSGFDLTGTPLEANAADGHNVAMVWFPGLSGTMLSANDVYGVERLADWILPSDGASLAFSNISDAVTRQANFTVPPVVIPEPASLALLGFGLFGFVMRRRRA